jgi:hypothetical protein
MKYKRVRDEGNVAAYGNNTKVDHVLHGKRGQHQRRGEKSDFSAVHHDLRSSKGRNSGIHIAPRTAIHRSGVSTCAAQLGITLDLLEVTILSEVDWRGPLGLDDSVVPAMTNLQPQVKISAAGVPQAVLSEIVRWGEEHSPVARTIKAGQLAPATISLG